MDQSQDSRGVCWVGPAGAGLELLGQQQVTHQSAGREQVLSTSDLGERWSLAPQGQRFGVRGVQQRSQKELLPVTGCSNHGGCMQAAQELWVPRWAACRKGIVSQGCKITEGAHAGRVTGQVPPGVLTHTPLISSAHAGNHKERFPPSALPAPFIQKT